MKTAEEIYSECLDQYITGNSKINKICSTQRQLSVYVMKLYANQKLDEASETAETEIFYGYYINGDPHYQVNKQSILNLKDNV